MDFATILGVTGALSLILMAIVLGGSPAGFADGQSVLIVVGGAGGAVLTSIPFSQLFNATKAGRKTVFTTIIDRKALVATLVEFAVVARRDGILALENSIDENTDRFIATGIRMAVDGTDPDLIERLLLAEVNSLAGRHKKGKAPFELAGKYAPAFGMIGTLIGLVNMLAHMDDPSSIGPGMAVALLTTLYGAVLANAVFLPMADKLAFYSKEELNASLLVLQGVMAIQSGDNPRIVEQKLNVFLPPNERNQEI